MTADTITAIKKAFPNMFRPLEWHHFDGKTEHGHGEWWAHGSRGMFHIYDVREKFPDDRPFYAKELSDQLDTLEMAQEAFQKRHEMDIVMCLGPGFLSTLESLQRENEELERRRIEEQERADRIAADWFEFCEMMEVTPDTQEAVACDIKAALSNAETDERNAVSRAEAAESEVKRLRLALGFYANPEIYKPHPHGPAFDRRDLSDHAKSVLSSTGDTHGN